MQKNLIVWSVLIEVLPVDVGLQAARVSLSEWAHWAGIPENGKNVTKNLVREHHNQSQFLM